MNVLIDYLRHHLTDDRSIEEVLRGLARAIPYVEDARDYVHDERPASEEICDYGPFVGLIENQWNMPICVAQSCEVIARVHTNRQREISIASPEQMADFNAKELYAWIKASDGMPDVAGVIPRNGMKALAKQGIKENYPDNTNTFKIGKYWKCKDAEQVINALLTTGPVLICIKCYRSFYDCSGILYKPKSREAFYGYHAIVLTGFMKGLLTGVNSWGTGWGSEGWFLLPVEYYNDWVTEAWCGI